MYRKCVLLLLLPSLSACVTRGEINAAIWLNNGIDPEICKREPGLNNYGFYRKLDSGKYQFISFCSPEAINWLSMHKDDFNRMIDATLPEKK